MARWVALDLPELLELPAVQERWVELDLEDHPVVKVQLALLECRDTQDLLDRKDYLDLLVLEEGRDHQAYRVRQALQGRLLVEDLVRLYQVIAVRVEPLVYQVLKAHLVQKAIPVTLDLRVLVVSLVCWAVQAPVVLLEYLDKLD